MFSVANEHRELMHWMKSQAALVGRKETAADLLGAEVLLEGHRDYKDEISAKEKDVKVLFFVLIVLAGPV